MTVQESADSHQLSEIRPRATEETTLTPVSGIIVADVEKYAEAYRFFEEFKKRLLKPEDSAQIQNRKHVKRSGWSKYRLACNVSDEVISHRRVPTEGKDPQGHFYHEFWVRAFHRPTGRSSVGVAIASNSERKSWAHEEHDVFTLAHTRAKNRATSDLVGGGEVSAEELAPGENVEEDTTQPSTQPPAASEWHVPVAKDPPQGEGLYQYPVLYSKNIVGVCNADQGHNELALVPDRPLRANAGPIAHFLVPKVLEGMKEKHGIGYELRTKDGQLEAVFVRGLVDAKHLEELLGAAGWAFQKAAESTKA